MAGGDKSEATLKSRIAGHTEKEMWLHKALQKLVKVIEKVKHCIISQLKEAAYIQCSNHLISRPSIDINSTCLVD